MTINTSRLQSEQEEFLDWSLLGKNSYQIDRRMELLKKIELETNVYFQVRFDKTRGAFFIDSSDREALLQSADRVISMKFIESANTALTEVEQNLGKPDQIDKSITKYIEVIQNPLRKRERTYIKLRSRKCVLEEKNALNKLAEGLELISAIREEIALYLKGGELSARSVWMEWGDSEQLSTIRSSDADSGRSHYISWS